ncbi:MAG: tetratricopeptide repeat protein, partial [Acidobacteriota bacterium]
ALNYLGYMWIEQGEKLEQSLEMVLRAVAEDPDNGAYVDSLGWAYYQLGRYEEAVTHLEWAAGLTPDDPTVFYHLGDTYAALGRESAARIAYGLALELAEDELKAEIESKIESLGDRSQSGVADRSLEAETGREPAPAS